MEGISTIQNEKSLHPYIISRAVFTALSPLDQIAATACERCGLVQIVDDDEENLTW